MNSRNYNNLWLWVIVFLVFSGFIFMISICVYDIYHPIHIGDWKYITNSFQDSLIKKREGRDLLALAKALKTKIHTGGDKSKTKNLVLLLSTNRSFIDAPIEGIIANTNEAENYLYYARKKGTLFIEVRGIGNTSPIVKLIDPKGNLLSEHQNKEKSSLLTIRTELPTAGSYTIRVGATSLDPIAKGVYTFRLSTSFISSIKDMETILDIFPVALLFVILIISLTSKLIVVPTKKLTSPLRKFFISLPGCKISPPKVEYVQLPRLERTTAIIKLLSHYSTDLHENRMLDEKMRRGLQLAHSGNWEETAEIFQDACANHPDFDIPHLWQANYIEQKHGALEAVIALQKSVKHCRRKYYLLEKAGELTLLNLGDVLQAIFFFAQAITVIPRTSDKCDFDRTFLFMKAIFHAFKDLEGEVWVDNVTAWKTHFSVSMISDINEIINAISTKDKKYIALLLAEIRKQLIQKFNT
jgi:tetratricopeptide (TPR) repeat protein